MSNPHPTPVSEAPPAWVSQRGVLHLNPAQCGPAVPAGLQRGLAAAVAQGPGAALLYLGGRFQASTLPASLAFWCRFAQAYLTAACLTPNLEAQRSDLGIAPPGDFSQWLEVLPPMDGGEHVDAAVLTGLWQQLQQALSGALQDFEGSVADYLHTLNPAWNSLGRVCFHLADNKTDAQRPFAFLATYSEGLGASNRPRHLPLSTALRTYAGQAQAEALARVLEPVKRAAASSALVKELLQSKALFAPQAWDARAAYRFLREIPVLERCGVAVRVPDWWHRRARPRVVATVGSQRASGLGLAALLDVDLQVIMDDEPLSREELESFAGQTGLVRLRGRWVEVDGARLEQALNHLQALQRDNPGGLDFAAAMRLLAGMPDAVAPEDPGASEPMAWVGAQAGPWLREALASLRSGEAWHAPAGLQATLRPYQQVGVQWLHGLGRLGLGACLADDMGLGKTLQIIALLLGSAAPNLLVVPASLLANWQQECQRFAPGLRVRVAHPSAEVPATSGTHADAVLTTYGMVARHAWLREAAWERVVLDEAQAIKNPGSRQARAVKQVRARQRIALTGTPVENRAADLWSLFDFINPGMLGTAKTFAKHVKVFEAPQGDGYAPLRRLVRPYILRRLKTDKAVVPDLPDKTEVVAWCGLRKQQAALYQETVAELERRLEDLAPMVRRGLILATMTRLKQICNHPSQSLGDELYAPAQSGKYQRLAELANAIAACGEKLLVFTQYREMTEPLRTFLAQTFGTPGFVLHGGTAVKARQALVQRFNEEDAASFFVLSLKAGGTGLNLTGANHVVHFDRWWNPAVENQATDRAFRIGQQRNVLVHKFVCRGTVEERIDALLNDKRKLSEDLLSGKAEVSLTEMSDADLLATVRLDLDAALAGD